MNTVRSSRNNTRSYMYTKHFTQAQAFNSEREAKNAIIANETTPIKPKQVAINWWVLEVGEIRKGERTYVRSVWSY